VKTNGRAYWEEHVKALAASGLSRAEYCRQHGLRYKQLYCWQGRLSTAGTKSKAFVRAKPAPVVKAVAAASRSLSGARLVTKTGAALEFEASTDPRWLARVIAELGGLAQ
jgi:hypothetical protein